jgi:DNA polymerase elongation subunit (family B)
MNNLSYIKDDAILKVEINGEFVELTKDEFVKIMDEQNLTISSAGVIYSQDKRGLLPNILDKWYEERTKYKKQMLDASKSGDKEKEEFYDKRQLVQKILLNSLYGVLGLPVFRFYDIDNAESVTLTGQDIIKASAKKLNSFYKNKLIESGIDEESIKNADFVTYCDTDSVAGTSMVSSDLFGEISIENLFSKLEDNDEEYVIDSDNREFIFPKELKLPYYNEIDKKICFGNVEYIEKHKVKKSLYKIKTKSGKEIIVSQDHSIMILDNDILIEKKPTEIKIGEKTIIL